MLRRNVNFYRYSANFHPITWKWIEHGLQYGDSRFCSFPSDWTIIGGASLKIDTWIWILWVLAPKIFGYRAFYQKKFTLSPISESRRKKNVAGSSLPYIFWTLWIHQLPPNVYHTYLIKLINFNKRIEQIAMKQFFFFAIFGDFWGREHRL